MVYCTHKYLGQSTAYKQAHKNDEKNMFIKGALDKISTGARRVECMVWVQLQNKLFALLETS